MQKTIKNRTIFCHDNLEILQGIDTGTINLIYLDPPFNKKKTFTAPIGSSAEGASFDDIFRQEDVQDEWIQTIKEDYHNIHELLNTVKNIEGRTPYNFCYLAYMAIRLIECHRILKETGSIYLHCDSTMSHYLKLLMDCIFGEKKFKGEIVWNTGSVSGYKSQKKGFIRNFDIILYYVKTQIFLFNKYYLPYRKKYIEKMFKGYDDKKKLRYRDRDGRRYYENDSRMPIGLNWTDIYSLQTITNSKQYVGYPTQKPVALLERIIRASSNEGDIVLDPFCGCATTCIAAEKLGRKWIGIDTSHKAYELVQARIKDEVYAEGLLKGEKGKLPEIHFTTTPPTRTDEGADIKDQKYIYVISHPQYKGEYKVGIASDVKSRLNIYQTSDPNRAYKLEHALLTGHYRALERHIHEKFDNRHEWVRANLQDIIDEIGTYRPENVGELFN